MGNRKMLYIPEIFPDTFVFFYYEGDKPKKYSLRDYSGGGTPRLMYGKSLPYSALQILDMSRYCYDAETVDTHDLKYWKEQTDFYNHKHLGKESVNKPPQSSDKAILPFQISVPNKTPSPKFPMLSLGQLLTHPVKASKAQDMERILTSPQSEDYVTWNMVQLLNQVSPASWWQEVLLIARADNPSFSFNPPPDDLPRIDLWHKVAAPKEYEKLSREKMGKSGNPLLVDRSKDSKPVEGSSEIDIVMRGRSYLIFIEAKLESDISLNTTYDPGRNQIIRNIDCLLEECGYRTPVFWMITKDKGPIRAYTQMMRRYQQDPRKLYKDLPHRDPKQLDIVAGNLAIIVWKDILPLVVDDDNDLLCQEIKHRIH